MEEDLALGLCIIKVLCLIVIAMGVHRIAYSNEYLVGDAGLYGKGQLSGQGYSYGTGAQLGFAQVREQSMFNNAEPPVFYNLGDADSINAELQAAAALGVDKSYSGFGNRSFASGAPNGGLSEHKLANLVGR